MKKFSLIILIVLFVSFQEDAVAQSRKNDRPLTPSRSYYYQLSKLDPEPSAKNSEWDALKFPFDKESAERRLSLKPYYLENVSADDFKIGNPPANSSEQTLAELSYLLQLQQQRKKIDVDASMIMAGVYYNPRVQPTDSSYHHYRSNLFFIGRSIGTWFHPDSLPLTANLVANVWRDAGFFIWSLKYKYLRVRPYVLDQRIRNLEETNWAAYPSGHASNSYVNAFIFSELAPGLADVFLKDAYDMAHSREIIGVHYPSDSEAGRVFARQLVNMLFQNEKFLNDFKLAKREWELKSRGYFGPVKVSPVSKVTAAASCGSTLKTADASCSSKATASACKE